MVDKDAVFSLKGSEGDNESVVCPIATTMKLFNALETNQRYSFFTHIRGSINK